MGTETKLIFWEWVYRARFVLAGFVILGSLFLWPEAGRLRTDPTNQSLFEAGRASRDHEYFQKVFGSDDTVIAAVAAPDVLDRKILRWIEEATDAAEKNPAVSWVQSLSRIKEFRREWFHLSEDSLIEKYLSREESRDALVEKIHAVREITSPLLNSGKNFTLIVVTLKAGLSSPARHEAVGMIRTWIRNHPVPNGRIYISGSAVEQDEFIQSIQKDHRFFVPVTFAVILIMIALTQANVFAIFYPASVIIATLISTQALMHSLHHSLNVVTTLVSPVILIVSISEAIHIQSHVHHVDLTHHGIRHLQALFQSLGIPCLLTSLTTAAGFFALMNNSVPAIRAFGWFAAMGTLFALLWTILLAPLFFDLHVRWHRARKQIKPSRLIPVLAEAVRKFHWLILVLSILLLAAGLFSMRRIRSETDILRSFPSDSPFRISTEEIQKQIGGVYNLELLLTAPDADRFWDRDELERLIRWKDSIRNLAGIAEVRYVTDILQTVDRAVTGSGDWSQSGLPSEKDLSRYRQGFRESADAAVNRIRSDDFRLTRMTVRLNLSNTRDTVRIADEITRLFAPFREKGWNLQIAGETYLLALMSEGLVRNELQSMAAAMGMVSLLMMAGLKSFRAGLVGALFNLIPIVLTLGLMPFLDISLNTATATVACVSLGLVVDYAIHVFYHYHRAMQSGEKIFIERIFTHCVRPLSVSTLVLCAGFSVTAFGHVLPTIHFGILMAVVLFLGLLSNLILLPSLLVTVHAGRSPS